MKTTSNGVKKIFEEIDLGKEKFKKGEIERKAKFLAKRLVKRLKEKKLFLATMESCTGGALINEITNVPRASEITKGGFVPYSIQEKIALGIQKKMIEKYSVYSPEIAIEMAKLSKRKIKGSDIGIGITGILSRPNPNFPEKELDQVDVATVFKDKILARRFYFPKKERGLAKEMIILKALEMIEEISKK